MRAYKFSRREKAMLVILVMLLLVALWYLLVYQPVQTRITDAGDETAEAQSEVVVLQAQQAKMQSMQAELDRVKAGGTVTPLPDYDNQSNVLDELSSALTGLTYNVSFADPETDDSGIVRRSVALTFSCGDYASAKRIVNVIASSRYRNQVQSLSISGGGIVTNTSGIAASRATSSSSAYTVSMTVVYYEKV